MTASVGAWILLVLLGLGAGPAPVTAEDAPGAPPAAPAPPATAKEVAELFRPLVADPAWKHVGFPVPGVLLRKQVADANEALTADQLQELQDGRTSVSVVPGEPVRATLLLLRFSSPEAAGEALGALRDALKSAVDARRDAAPPWLPKDGSAGGLTFEAGAGPDGSLEGYVLRNGLGPDVTVQHVARLGPFLAMLNLEGAAAPDRAAQDRVLERAALWFSDPRQAAAQPSLAPAPFQRAYRELRLRVTGPAGEDVHAARLQVDLGETRTDFMALRKGEARLIVPRAGSATLTILQPRDDAGQALPFAPVLKRAVPTEGGDWTIALEPGLGLSGLVLDPEGAPAAHMRIVATAIHEGIGGLRAEGPDWDVADARSEGNGTFALDGLARGALYRLRVFDGTQALPSDQPEVRAGADGVTIRLRPASAPLLIVLDAEGRPVEGALVTCWIPGTSGRTPSAMTDGLGRARLEGLAADEKGQLQIEPPPGRPELAGHRQEDWLPAPTTIRLARGWSLTGQLLDPRGAPTSGAIELEEGPGSHSFHDTDAEGRFRLDGLPPGPARMRAIHTRVWTGRVLRHGPQPEPTEVAQGTSDVRLTLHPSREVHIRVRGPQGEPVASVRVRLGNETSHSSATLPGEEVRVEATDPTTRLNIEEPEDAQGRRLPYGRYVGPIPAPEPGGVELRLGLPRALKGRVLGPDGSPVRDARVRWAAPGADPNVPQRNAWHESASDADGRFELLGVDPGPIFVDVLGGPDHAALPPRLVGLAEQAIELRLPAGVLAEIAVVDAAGQPVPDALIEHRRVALPSPGTEEYSGHAEVRTDAQGRARLGVFADDQVLDVEVKAPPGRPTLLEHRARLAGPRLERVVLEEGRIVRGRVLHADGTPAPEAWVALRALGPKADPFAWTRLGESDRQGRFVTRALPKGAQMLQAGVPSSSRPGPGVVVGADEESVTLRLAPADVELVLKFQPTDARPWFYASPLDQPLLPFTQDVRGPADLWEEPTAVKVDAATGRAVLSVPQGPTRVWIPSTEADPRCALLSVEAPGEIQIQLSESQPITVDVVLPEGATQIDVHAHGPFDHRLRGRPTDVRDRYKIEGLPPGTWKVCVDAMVGPAFWHATADVAAGAATQLVAKPVPGEGAER